MKQILPLFFLIAFHSFGLAQNMNDYNYVVVPDQFEFQTQVNQYQLNEMTKFYLNKNGFHAFLNSEAPNADKCKGLYANVEYERSWLQTKMEIVLHDCEKNEVYRSPIGKSKLKELDKSKQEALREAFAGFSTLKVRQKPLDMTDYPKEVEPNSKSVASKQPENPGKNSPKSVGPAETFTAYTFENASYILRKTDEGYSLYKESETEDGNLELIGKIIDEAERFKFSNTSGNESEAVFEGGNSLIIINGTTNQIFTKVE